MIRLGAGNWLWGRYSAIGFAVAIIFLLSDQLHKTWMIHIYKIGEKGVVEVTSFLNLVMEWNPGISYGLFPQESAFGQIALIVFALVAVGLFTFWLARTEGRLEAIAIGLIIGGAMGNAIDRAIYGKVADFFSFHAYGFYWYVFNIADVAIVAGVIGLLYEFIFKSPKKVSNLPQ